MGTRANVLICAKYLSIFISISISISIFHRPTECRTLTERPNLCTGGRGGDPIGSDLGLDPMGCDGYGLGMGMGASWHRAGTVIGFASANDDYPLLPGHI